CKQESAGDSEHQREHSKWQARDKAVRHGRRGSRTLPPQQRPSVRFMTRCCVMLGHKGQEQTACRYGIQEVSVGDTVRADAGMRDTCACKAIGATAPILPSQINYPGIIDS